MYIAINDITCQNIYMFKTHLKDFKLALDHLHYIVMFIWQLLITSLTKPDFSNHSLEKLWLKSKDYDQLSQLMQSEILFTTISVTQILLS